METELKRAAEEVVELAAAAKALLGSYETHLAKAVNDLELAKNRSSDHEGQIRKTLDAISRSGQELVRQQRELVTEIERSWALKVDRNAAVAGAEQAKLFGIGITAGLLEKLQPLTARVEAATKSFRWQSAVKWGAAIGIAIPLTVAIGVWAFAPHVDGVSSFEVQYAMQRLEPCTIGKERHVCIASDPKRKVTSADGDARVVIQGL